MFSGIQEILLILLIIVAILFLPRLMPRKQSSSPSGTDARKMPSILSGRLRLAVVLSFIWLLLSAAYYEPWRLQNIRLFLYFGMGPVIFLWGGIWIFSGYNKNRK